MNNRIVTFAAEAEINLISEYSKSIFSKYFFNMRKFVVILIMGIIGLNGFSIAAQSFSIDNFSNSDEDEKGRMAVGVHFYDNPKISDLGNAFGAGVSFRYSFTDNIRAKLTGSYFTGEVSGIDLGLEFQWATMLGEKWIIYPAIGVGYLAGDYDISIPSFLIGSGVEYYFNRNWMLTFDFKAQITSSDGAGFPVTLGVAYSF